MFQLFKFPKLVIKEADRLNAWKSTKEICKLNNMAHFFNDSGTLTVL